MHKHMTVASLVFCSVCLTTAQYAQVTKPTGLLKPQRSMIASGECSVNQLLFEFRTGNDDLRGGDNNLNVEIHFADGSMQVARNVNHGASWPNNSDKTVTVPLGGTSGDNWNMDSVQIIAVVNGANEAIANYGFHRFSSKWSGPEAKSVTIATK